MAVSTVTLPVVGRDLKDCGYLKLSLPRSVRADTIPPPLLDLRDSYRDTALEPVQLLEGLEYVFEFCGFDAPGALDTDHPELFVADDVSGRRGRLRPGLCVGTVSTRISVGNVDVGAISLEVRSLKLDYFSDYRQMLADIAERFTEIVMERFAASELRFTPDQSADARTLYSRFAFLKGLISNDSFEAALGLLLRRPHVGWTRIEEFVRPGRPVRGGSQLVRELTKPGRRVSCEGAIQPWIRAEFRAGRSEATFDTIPNRFVKFALERWCSVLRQVQVALADVPRSASVERGRSEIAWMLAHFDDLLAGSLFREVGRLSYFPAENQVLQKRAGYRDVLRAYIHFEFAARLSWEGGDDVYRAGQKDVATLYEYWVFLELGVIVQELCGTQIDFSTLFRVEPNGIGIQLRRNRQTILRGTVTRNGRRLELEYCYNRTFVVSSESDTDSSWSRRMRPDCSLKIAPAIGELATFEPIWVHFDAKYRVERLQELFGQEDQTEEGTATFKRDDLLKMHAYRDAIRRSAGAYVIYPGTEDKRFSEFHELLPGLGAFALRPGDGCTAIGAVEIRRFLDDVLDHVSMQISQHERARYWARDSFAKTFEDRTQHFPATFLRKPAADTRVLIAYVKGTLHEEWIRKTKMYNLRADGRSGSITAEQLAVDFIVFCGPTCSNALLVEPQGHPLACSAQDLLDMGYPAPGGSAYLCLRWAESGHALPPFDYLGFAARYTELRGSPLVCSWAQIMTELAHITRL